MYFCNQDYIIPHRSCLQHYKMYPYDEEHEFKLQIKPALISHFYQKYFCPFCFVHTVPLLKEKSLAGFQYDVLFHCSRFHIFHREHPVMWGVEVSSGHGPREVRTCLQFSDQPLVDHVVFKTGVVVVFFSMLIPNIIHVTFCETYK